MKPTPEMIEEAKIGVKEIAFTTNESRSGNFYVVPVGHDPTTP